MRKLPHCIWPHVLNPDTSVSVRIGRSIHWLLAAVGSAAILLGLAMVARAYLIDPAAAQGMSEESDAFKAADPATQRAIIDMRAIDEEVRKPDRQARTGHPVYDEPDNIFTRADARARADWNRPGAWWSGFPASQPAPDAGEPPNRYEQALAAKAATPPPAGTPPSLYEQAIAAKAAAQRLQDAFLGLKLIIAGLLLVFVGRASRYVLSNE